MRSHVGRKRHLIQGSRMNEDKIQDQDNKDQELMGPAETRTRTWMQDD